jgi:hypothetical protein
VQNEGHQEYFDRQESKIAEQVYPDMVGIIEEDEMEKVEYDREGNKGNSKDKGPFFIRHEGHRTDFFAYWFDTGG